MAEILDSMNQVLHMMVDSQRVQEEMLAAVIKNGEKLILETKFFYLRQFLLVSLLSGTLVKDS